MPSFEIPADIFTHPSVSDPPKGSSNAVKTYKDMLIRLGYFGRTLEDDCFKICFIRTHKFGKNPTLAENLTFTVRILNIPEIVDFITMCNF